MRLTRFLFIAALWTVILCIGTLATRPALACGVERWSVKTGTDADKNLVNLTPQSNTIATMVGWPSQSNPPANNRIAPYETQVWVIQATLVEYKSESDQDYHLVLQDGSGHSMIAEIPDPSCLGSGSVFSSGVTNARAEFDAKYSVSGSFQTANIPVQVTGCGMFDFAHGQTGAAPNQIELHSVLDIIFNPGSGNPPPTPTMNAPTTGSGSVSLSWSASSGATSYTLYRSTSSGTETAYKGSLTSTSYTDTGVTNGTTYYYKVVASNSSGTSGKSNEVSATPQASGSAPTAPTLNTPVASSGKVALTWSAPTGATRYTLLRSTTSGSEASYKTGLTSASYNDTSVTNGTTYYYKVTASNSFGTSPLSNEVNATPQANPDFSLFGFADQRERCSRGDRDEYRDRGRAERLHRHSRVISVGLAERRDDGVQSNVRHDERLVYAHLHSQ